MLKKLIARINTRIAHRLALWVILFSIITTLMTSAVQLYLQYRQDLEGIKKYFDSISYMQLKSLSQSVWIMDDKQIQAHLDGITKGRDIIYASIESEGRTLWSSGSNEAREAISLEYDLSHRHRDESYRLGKLQIVASLDNLYERLSWSSLVVILTNSLKTFLFAGCILLYFQYAVTRHLEKLASHVVNIDFRHKAQPLDLARVSMGDGDEVTQVVNMLNILQRRGYHAFQALQKSELRLRLFFDATEEGIFGISSEGRITFANSACLKRIGYDDWQSVIGRRVADIISYFPETNEEIVDGHDVFLKPLLSGRSIQIDDGFLQVANGPCFYASIRVYPILSDDVHSGAVVFFNDISEQREMVKEKNLLSQAIRQSPLLVIISDATGHLEYVNPGFEKLTGYSLREVIGKQLSELGLQVQNCNDSKVIRETLQTEEKWQAIYSMRSKDGKEYIFDSLVFPVFNSRNRIINTIALWMDITQKVALQNQLNRAQKMDAVGRLSASFAHEFGNPLLGVRSVIKDISERIPMEQGDKQLLQLAYGECERMKSLIRDFQRFQRSSDSKGQHDVHAILDSVLFFYKNHLEKNRITLVKLYQQDMPQIYVSKNQIFQVFLNLIINAVDAMAATGGTLEISTDYNDREVSIAIKDTGIGIGEPEKDLIFEPFYTTKQEVQGTGLGLSVSYSIISGHGGDITVASQVNEGAAFTVHLPRQQSISEKLKATLKN